MWAQTAASPRKPHLHLYKFKSFIFKLQGPASVVEYEDLTMEGILPPEYWGADGGQSAVRSALRMAALIALNGLPANFTLLGPQSECQFGYM